ncbi:MAG: FtsW/RodA/SpoVE family cell cycle protein [Proteobacteria bacterium]|nr:FtsW/RodA/SpoVE family cell cycle protein [Pseudomonadota bacterium]
MNRLFSSLWSAPADSVITKDIYHPAKGSWIILVSVLLALFGLANLYSITSSMEKPYFLLQLRHWLVGLAIIVSCVLLLSHKTIKQYAYPFVIFHVILLVIVLWLGDASGGSRRWLDLGIIRFQPSELSKVAMALLGAKFLSTRKHLYIHSLQSLLPLLAAAIGLCLLIFLQPDLGTAALTFLVVVVQLMFVRIHKKSIWIAGLLGICSLAMGWLFILHDYQKQRIFALLHPQLDPTGRSYSQLQSLVAVGSGGDTGKGFLNGTQSHLRFLPSHHTDFVFSGLAEEHGFWRSCIVFILFAMLTYLGLAVGRDSKDSFLALLAIGITTSFFLAFCVNIAMVVGLFPVVGVVLPFFSYGGSAVIALAMMLALLLIIDSYNNRVT